MLLSAAMTFFSPLEDTCDFVSIVDELMLTKQDRRNKKSRRLTPDLHEPRRSSTPEGRKEERLEAPHTREPGLLNVIARDFRFD